MLDDLPLSISLEQSMDPIVGERCVICPYIGTNYCTYLCEDWLRMPIPNCALDCGVCTLARICPCTRYALPREIILDEVQYFLTNPNTPPCHNTMAFQEKYKRPPEFLIYIKKWGVFVMGPVKEEKDGEG